MWHMAHRIILTQIQEVAYMSAVAGYGTSAAIVLVLYILLVIILSAGFFI